MKFTTQNPLHIFCVKLEKLHHFNPVKIHDKNDQIAVSAIARGLYLRSSSRATTLSAPNFLHNTPLETFVYIATTRQLVHLFVTYSKLMTNSLYTIE